MTVSNLSIGRTFRHNWCLTSFSNLKRVGKTAVMALALTTAATSMSSCDTESKRIEREKQEMLCKQRQDSINQAKILKHQQDSIAKIQAQYAQLRQKQIKDSLENNNRVKLLDGISLFQDVDKNSLAKFTKEMKIKDIECTKENNGTTELFAHTKDYTYDMILGKADDGAIAGLVSKETKDGKNELYLLRMDFIDTNKSYKMKLSHMRVVQDGVSNDSETSKKYISKTTEQQTENINCTTVKDGEVHYNTVSGGGSPLGILVDEVHVSTPEFIEKARTTKGVNTINKIIINEKEDGRKITTYSLDKSTGIVTRTGDNILCPENKYANKPGYTLVKGPHNTEIYIKPGYVSVSRNGLTYIDRIGAFHKKKYKTAYSKKELQNLINKKTNELCTDKANYEQWKSSKYCCNIHVHNYESIPYVIEAAQQILEQMEDQ